MTIILLPTIIFSLVLALALIFKLWQRRRNNKIIAESTDLRRGTASERAIIPTLRKCGIQSQDIYHDLYLRRRNGAYVQVDIVALTEVGVIVFELKDYKGWLFGDGEQKKWTQTLNYGKIKHSFYNPIMQNEGHIVHLRELCPQLRNVPLYSVIVFSGDCRFRKISNIPQGVHLIYESQLRGVLRDILSNPPVTYTNRGKIEELLNQARANGADNKIVAEHIAYVRSRHGNDFGSKNLFIRVILSPFRLLRIIRRLF